MHREIKEFGFRQLYIQELEVRKLLSVSGFFSSIIAPVVHDVENFATSLYSSASKAVQNVSKAISNTVAYVGSGVSSAVQSFANNVATTFSGGGSSSNHSSSINYASSNDSTSNHVSLSSNIGSVAHLGGQKIYKEQSSNPVSAIVSAGKTAVQAVTIAIANAGNAVENTIVKPIVVTTQEVAKTAVSATSDAISAVDAVFGGVQKNNSTGIQNQSVASLKNPGASAVDAVMAGIGKVAPTFNTYRTSTFNFFGIKPIVLTNVVGNGLEELAGYISQHPEVVTETSRPGIEALIGPIKSVAQTVAPVVNTAAKNVENFGAGVIDGVKSLVTGVGSLALDAVHLTPIVAAVDPAGAAKTVEKWANVVTAIATDPMKVVDAFVGQYKKEYGEGGLAKAIGFAVPDIALTVASFGVGGGAAEGSRAAAAAGEVGEDASVIGEVAETTSELTKGESVINSIVKDAEPDLSKVPDLSVNPRTGEPLFPSNNPTLKISADLANKAHGPHYDVVQAIQAGTDQMRVSKEGEILGGITNIGKKSVDWEGFSKPVMASAIPVGKTIIDGFSTTASVYWGKFFST